MFGSSILKDTATGRTTASMTRSSSGPTRQFYGPRFYGSRYERGSLRLEVKPEETEVFVDGYFQRLHLPPGEHEVELYLDGYESTRETLYVVEGQTYRIRHDMQPLPDGAPQATRPEPVPAPASYANEYRVQSGGSWSNLERASTRSRYYATVIGPIRPAWRSSRATRRSSMLACPPLRTSGRPGSPGSFCTRR